MEQTVPLGQINFDFTYLKNYELCKSVNDYHPLIISINYNEKDKQYAMMSYGIFTKDGNGLINGARIEKQIVLVSLINS
jgi:hypothetical protein